MKVGSKGQVVIPKALRKALNIHPGSRVIFRLEGDRLILQKCEADAVALLLMVAEKGPSIKIIPPHLYTEEIEGRAKLNALS